MEPWMEPLLGALLIFCLRLIGVSVGTVRMLMAVRGRRLVAGVMGFFEVTIFLVAISQVLTNIGNWWNVLGYAGGFAVGTILGMTIEKKLAMRSGETDSAITVDDPILFGLAQTVSSHSKHLGVLDLDVVIVDRTPYILEMNPRFGGHYPFAHLAGAKMPAAIIAWAQGREPDPSWLKAEMGVKGYKELVPTRISEIRI